MHEHTETESSYERITHRDVEQAVTLLMSALGYDPEQNEHLRDTPRRIAAMYLDELFCPIDYTFTTFAATTTGMIVQKDIEFVSVCSHHLVPFRGVAHVGYIPYKTMCGLSKLARTVEWYARRPQVQEAMTEEIADRLETELSALGVAVSLEAEHLCMSVRGVQKAGAVTVTTALRGAFLEKPEARAEFFAVIGRR